jgi:hypothetical protein
MKTSNTLLFALLVLTFVYSNASAQHSIGATMNAHVTAPNCFPCVVMVGLADYGSSAFAIYRQEVSNWVFIGGEMGYSRDRMYLVFPFFVSNYDDILVDVDYWRMALIAGLKYGIGPVNFRISVGPSLGYLARLNIRPAFEKEQDVVYDQPSALDFALIGGGEVGVEVSSNLEFFVGARYARSISYIWSESIDKDVIGRTREPYQAYLWLGSQHFQFGFLVDI